VERSRALPLAALAGLVATLAASPAAAQPGKGAAQAIPVVEVDGDADTGEARPAAPDERKGHIYLGVGATAMGPVGAMAPATPSTSLAAAGVGFGAFLGVGLGRHATLQIFGDRTLFFSPSACSRDCGGRAYSAGLGLTYHLAQGLAFDPWASFGVAYRDSLFEVVNPANPDGKRIVQRYRGVDFARIGLGGDFYPTPFFGLGPWIELDLGTNASWPKPLLPLPDDVKNTPRIYGLFQVGVRIAFDPMRKVGRPTVARAAGMTPGY